MSVIAFADLTSLGVDILSIVFSYLPDDSIKLLYSPYLIPILSNMLKSRLFWKQRCETLLCKHLQDRNLDWMRTYYSLRERINGGHDPIEASILFGQINNVEIFLEIGMEIPVDILLIIANQCAFENMSKITQILLSTFDSFVINNEAIIDACINGHTQIISKYLDNENVDFSAEDNEAIIGACRNGHTQIVKLLLNNKDVNPSAQNNQAIIDACFNGHMDIIEILVADARVDGSIINNEILIEQRGNYCNGMGLLSELLYTNEK